MWCSDCQQDVPAVASSAREPLVCPRCRSDLDLTGIAALKANGPKDDGIALESFDRSAAEDLSAPVDWSEQEDSRQRLQQIGRKLRGSSQYESALGNAAVLNHHWPAATPTPMPTPPPVVQPEEQLRSVARRSATEPTDGQTKTSWLVSLLLCGGVIGFGVGVGLLAWSAVFQLPQFWRVGMTLTIGAEGLLILSLTWMAARLWSNGRRVNRQLHGVDQQLTEMQEFAGSLAGSNLSSSQHYYHHFSQAASPHMLVANLQGQVDQLAARL